MFSVSGKFRVDLFHDFIQICDKAAAALNDLPSVIDQLRIPYTERILQFRELIHITQQPVSVLHRLVVLVEIVQIGGIQLAQLHIHEPSSLGRTVFDDSQVLR